MNGIKLVELMEMPRECVYAMVCHTSKRFMVGYTDHLFAALYRLSLHLETPKYALLKKDIKEVEVVVLDVGVQNKRDRKIKVNEYVSDYLSKGYSQYFPSNMVKYTVHTDVIVHRFTTFLVVYLKDKRCNKVVVGLFKSKKVMDEWVNTYYPNMKCSGIYYADNKYTNKYREKNNEDKWSIG